MIYRLRNLRINDDNPNGKEDILTALSELKTIIENNHKKFEDREIILEFNLGSRIGRQHQYLVIYSSPAYRNNPYIFILNPTECDAELHQVTNLSIFADLQNKFMQQTLRKAIFKRYQHLPKHRFLSEEQIFSAREFASNDDEFGLP